MSTRDAFQLSGSNFSGFRESSRFPGRPGNILLFQTTGKAVACPEEGDGMFFIKDREKALRRYDFFLIFLAVASVGLIIAEERMDFTEAEEGIFGLVDTAVWLIFVGDYFSRLFLAGDKKTVRENPHHRTHRHTAL